MATQLYAIRQISTGKYLPQSGRRKRGYTYDEPSDVLAPRLFTSTGAAKNALRWWLEGTSYRMMRQTGLGDEVEEVKTIKQEHRIPHDMQIIKVYIST